MATDTTKLQGEIVDDPQAQELDVEKLLMGFLRALLDEQQLSGGASAPAGKETAR